MKLTKLVCGSCGAFLGGLGTDSLFFCRNCGAGWTGEGEKLEPLTTVFRTEEQSDLHLPFWRVSAAVHVLKRTVRNEFVTTILSLGSKYDESTLSGKTRETGGTSERREMLFPAFHVKGLPGLGVDLSQCIDSLPPELEPGRAYPVVCGGGISGADAEVLARCVAVGQETEKSDWLAEIELVISSVRRSIEILPCTLEVEKVHIASTGVSFFRRSVPLWNGIMDFYSGES